jgi:hypothetical protein
MLQRGPSNLSFAANAKSMTARTLQTTIMMSLCNAYRIGLGAK